VVGRVEDAHVDQAGTPLVFWASRFGCLGGPRVMPVHPQGH